MAASICGAMKPPIPPAEYRRDNASERRRTNQRATPACAAMIAPVATPIPTISPNATIARTTVSTIVASITEPAITKPLPMTSVQRTPMRLTLAATSGPGRPDIAR